MIELIAQAPLFKGLTEKELNHLIETGAEQDFKQGEIVFDKNTATSEMFVLLEGKVSVIVQLPGYAEAIEVATIGKGETFGEVSFMDGKPRSATIKSLTDTKVLRIGRGDFNALVEKDPRIGIIVMNNMINILCERLRETDKDLTSNIKNVKDQHLKSRIHTFYSRFRR